MRIAIAGGTGTLGRRVVDELRAGGHDVRALSRSSAEHRVDLTTGEGLAAALEGCEVVVDASNAARAARKTLVEGGRRLLAAEAAAGVGHHVCISIVGCDRVPLGYYGVKTEQEQVVRQGPVPWSVVRATQFHEFVAGMLGGAARLGVVPVPRARVQSVACEEVARDVADVAERPALRDRIEVAGPENLDLRDMAHTWRGITGSRAILAPIPLPGKLGRTLRAGGLTTECADVRGRLTFASVVTAQQR